MKIEPRADANQLLAKLPKEIFQRLEGYLKPVKFELEKLLYEARAPVEYTYFPTCGTASAVTVMRDGSMIEVATVGNEGAVGLPGLSPSTTSPHRVFIQIAGKGMRIETAVLHSEAQKDEGMERLFEAYRDAFLFQVSQSVACNGLHVVQKRCCRWLLMAHDRIEGDDIGLTHEFLSYMLGVRCASVTDILQVLEKQGLIKSSRGKITIVDREGMEANSCECYMDVRNEYQRLLG